MSGYKELIHSYKAQYPADGPVTGSRVYIKVATGGGALPIVGTSLLPDETGTPITGCLCRIKKVVRDLNDTNYQYHFEYSTSDTSLDLSGTGVSTDPGDRSLEVQAESLSFQTGDNEVWEALDSNNTYQYTLQDTSIYKRIVLIPFSIPRANLTAAAYNTLLTAVKTRAGTINNAAFEGFAAGQVLFEGIRGSTFTNASGLKRWSVELIFKARLLNGLDPNANLIAADDWLYIFDNYYVKPRNSAGKYLYEKTDFSALV